MSQIVIDLQHTNDCPSGRYVSQVKTTKQDRQLIGEAAALVGLSRAAFFRICALQAARQVHDHGPA